MKFLINRLIKFVQIIVVRYDIDIGPFLIMYAIGVMLSMIQSWEKTHSVITTTIFSLLSWFVVIYNILVGY